MGWGWDGIGGCRRLGRVKRLGVGVWERGRVSVCTVHCSMRWWCVEGGREEERDEEGDGLRPRRTGDWDLACDLDWTWTWTGLEHLGTWTWG